MPASHIRPSGFVWQHCAWVLSRMRGMAWILIFVTISGCAGYKLGPSNGFKAGEKSVIVRHFTNLSPEPGLVDPIMTAIRREIQNDGTYFLETHGAGNYLISGEILNVNREAISLNPSRIEASRDLRLTLICQVKVIQRNTGDIAWDRTVTARTVVRNEGDLNRADQIVAPMLAETLARKIVSMISDGEWSPVDG